MSTTTEQDREVKVRVNGFELEGDLLDIRTILGLDPTGQNSIESVQPRPRPTLEPKTTEQKEKAKATRRTAKETSGEQSKAAASNDDDLPDFDMDAVLDWLIETGQRQSKVGRKPNAAAVRAYLEAKGKRKAA